MGGGHSKHCLKYATWCFLMASEPALGLANQRRVNFKPHPGAFQGRTEYLRWSRYSVDPRKSSCKWPCGGRFLQWRHAPTHILLSGSIKHHFRFAGHRKHNKRMATNEIFTVSRLWCYGIIPLSHHISNVSFTVQL